MAVSYGLRCALLWVNSDSANPLPREREREREATIVASMRSPCSFWPFWWWINIGPFHRLHSVTDIERRPHCSRSFSPNGTLYRNWFGYPEFTQRPSIVSHFPTSLWRSCSYSLAFFLIIFEYYSDLWISYRACYAPRTERICDRLLFLIFVALPALL